MLGTLRLHLKTWVDKLVVDRPEGVLVATALYAMVKLLPLLKKNGSVLVGLKCEKFIVVP